MGVTLVNGFRATAEQLPAATGARVDRISATVVLRGVTARAVRAVTC